MKIQTVEVHTVIIVNGEQFIRKVENHTDSVAEAQKAGFVLNTPRDVVDWLTSIDAV